MLLVGLTGGLGSGKSTVARMLAERGAIVVDADRVAREALDPGTHGYHEVRQAFGDQILGSDGNIDREALARVVFADEHKRRALESIVHPEVFRRVAEAVERHRETDAVVVFDAPLIVETGFHDACDVVVVVTAPLEEQVARVARDRGMSGEEARSRIAAQIPAAEREAVADVIIQNDGVLHSLERRVGALWEDLRGRADGS